MKREGLRKVCELILRRCRRGSTSQRIGLDLHKLYLAPCADPLTPVPRPFIRA